MPILALSRTFLAVSAALLFSTPMAWADTPAPAPAAEQVTKPSPSAVKQDPSKPTDADIKAQYSAALFKLIARTQSTIHESLSPVETDLATKVEVASKQLLADKDVYNALLNMAMYRDKLNGDDSNPERASRSAMGTLQSLLRQTPGVMDNAALINRAKLIAKIAKYYGKHDPSLCSYYPQDYSTLLTVDAPWLTDVDEDLVTQALEDEAKAVKTILSGIPPLIINDSDVQKVFAKFAGEWLGSVDEATVKEVAQSRSQGNYCVLWSAMLNDIAKMSEAYPGSTQKILLPMLTTPTRGWLDVGLWSYRPGGATPDPAADAGDDAEASAP
jgi:hypothetical protein